MNARRRALLGLLAAGCGGVWARPVRVGLPSGGVPVGCILEVGPKREFRRIADAARVARPGDTVAVDAEDYRADVAVWKRDWLTLRARGGPVRLISEGAHAEGKGIWVVRARDRRIEGSEFIGERAADRNGAGDGQSHHLYAGAIARLVVMGCYFHRGRVGHLLKSRAQESRILYSRLTDEEGGHASYELDPPNGGDAVVVGNLIQQSASTENFGLLSYGAEGYRWPKNALAMAHNTLVNDRPAGGRFQAVRPRNVAVTLVNTIIAGVGSVDAGAPSERAGNANLARTALKEAQPYGYRMAPAVRGRWAAIRPEELGRADLRADREYLHPRRLRVLAPRLALRAGAIQAGY